MTTPTPTAAVRKLGPGALAVGEAGSTIDLAVRCRAAKIVPGVDTEDDTPLLDGSVSAGDRTYTATLEATLEQDDLEDGSVVAFSWEHRGEQLPATFTPYNGGKSVVGELIIDPMDIGGDVGKKNTSDIKWAFVGFPDLVDDL